MANIYILLLIVCMVISGVLTQACNRFTSGYECINSNQYKNCGEETIQNCASGKYCYDGGDGPIDACHDPPPNCTTKGYFNLFEQTGRCDVYLKCENNNTTPQVTICAESPDGQFVVFNSKVKSCIADDYDACNPNRIIETPQVSICNFTGLIHNPNNCSEFFQCRLGDNILGPYPCLEMYPYFDRKSKQCVDFDLICPCINNQFRPIGQNCKTFLKCEKEEWRTRTCFSNKYFNNNTCTTIKPAHCT